MTYYQVFDGRTRRVLYTYKNLITAINKKVELELATGRQTYSVIERKEDSDD